MARSKLGFALTGSFCTFRRNLDLMRELSGEYDIIPIFSFHAAALDTRFGKAADVQRICAQIVSNRSFHRDFVLIYIKLVYQNRFDLIKNHNCNLLYR